MAKPRKLHSITFQYLIRQAINDKRSIRTLAREANIPPETLRRWTNDGWEPAALADLERLAHALGFRIEVGRSIRA